METIDLKIKTTVELKAHVYDQTVVMRNAQTAIDLINAEIESREKQPFAKPEVVSGPEEQKKDPECTPSSSESAS